MGDGNEVMPSKEKMSSGGESNLYQIGLADLCRVVNLFDVNSAGLHGVVSSKIGYTVNWIGSCMT